MRNMQSQASEVYRSAAMLAANRVLAFPVTARQRLDPTLQPDAGIVI